MITMAYPTGYATYNNSVACKLNTEDKIYLTEINSERWLFILFQSLNALSIGRVLNIYQNNYFNEKINLHSLLSPYKWNSVFRTILFGFNSPSN